MSLKKKSSVLNAVQADRNFGLGVLPAAAPAKIPGPSTVTPTIGQVLLYSSDPNVRVTARMDGGFKPRPNVGGWVADDVPKAGQTTSWKGTELLLMDGVIVLHSFDKQSVERDITSLLTLATKQPNRQTPPAIRMRGNVPFSDRVWVIAAPPESQRELWHDGARYSVTYALTVWEYQPTRLISTARSSPSSPSGGLMMKSLGVGKYTP